MKEIANGITLQQLKRMVRRQQNTSGLDIGKELNTYLTSLEKNDLDMTQCQADFKMLQQKVKETKAKSHKSTLNYHVIRLAKEMKFF